ncbi:mechanosensitive ion channel family protein [Alteromonas aestuariivivens]|uniref:Small-conductance mechanosensitive channel n=1 Tax=Alteromonas aestuariivivens TaxID=1938339 RepID=A0A3D8MBE5_9ALTE|nr:mechanosensitive ion channel family protein [Alteromonas aestuariivivens]RDV27547.1 mechanosensitive ion channel family protein [Alteromonas aestuariivivens]
MRTYLVYFIAVFVPTVCGLQVLAQEAPSATTVSEPEIPTDHLSLLLDPLTKSELEAEVLGWQGLLQAKVRDIAMEEIRIRKQNAVIESKQADSGDQQTEQAEQQKRQDLEKINALREQKAALLERFDIAIEAFKEKGGEAEDYRLYADAVTGIKVQASDGQAIWSALTGWFTSKEGGIKWAKKLLSFVVVMLIFWVLAKIIGSLANKAIARSRNMSSLLKNFLDTFVKRTVLFVGLLVALSIVGVEVGAILALVGGGAFILGFALQDTLGNFAAGIMLLLYKPFDVDDIVEVGGVFGKVDSVSLVNTTIRTFDNQVTLVPNKQVWGQIITNATASHQRRVDLVFGISYSDDIDKAEEVMWQVVENHPLVLKDPETVIEVNSLGESSVDFVCRPWAKTDDYWRVYWDLTKQVKLAFDEAGISIPFPQRDVHLFQHQQEQLELQMSPAQNQPPHQHRRPDKTDPAPVDNDSGDDEGGGESSSD